MVLTKGPTIYFSISARAFAAQDDADAHYNRGNALARGGRLEQAVAAYDAALARDPDHEDAAFNRELVSRLMERQRREPESTGQSPESRRREGGAQGAGEAARTPQGRQPEGEAQSAAGGDAEEGEQERDAASPFTAGAQREQSVESLTMEEQQAIEQWLRRVPDDPGGLLRNKFKHQYQQREQQPATPRSDAW